MKKKNLSEGAKGVNRAGLHNPRRRAFLKKLGMGFILASTYSIISITQFGCVHDPTDDMVPRGGY